MQLHLTFIVESRVLRIQKMCRLLFRVKNRASAAITSKMKLLKSKKLLLMYSRGSHFRKSGDNFFVQSGRLSSQRKSAEEQDLELTFNKSLRNTTKILGDL